MDNENLCDVIQIEWRLLADEEQPKEKVRGRLEKVDKDK
jgi:hypothetical protein